MGHCSSYDDVEIVNTAWAREMEARSQQTGVVIPSNITPGPFVQFAADNNDFNEETLDGKQTTNATMLVMYQRQPFGPKLPPKIQADHTSRRRSLEQPVQGQFMHECSVHGKRPALTSFVRTAEENFELREDSTTTQNIRELAWFLLRLIRKNVLKADDTWWEQSVSGWRAFNAEMSPITLPRTVIGYCPMIAGSPTEYNTICTILKTVQEMSKHLQQSTAVITFDLTIYSKAHKIHWRYPEEFQNLVIRLGRVSHSTQLFGIDWKDVPGERLRGCVHRVWPLLWHYCRENRTTGELEDIKTFQVLVQVHRDDSPSSKVHSSRTRGWLAATSKGYNKDDSLFFLQWIAFFPRKIQWKTIFLILN